MAYKIKAFGFEFDLPAWAAGIAALGILSGLGWWHVRQDEARIPKSALVQLEHSQRHFTEHPEIAQPLFKDARGEMEVSYYASDGCLLVHRHGQTLDTAVWVLDPRTLPPAPALGQLGNAAPPLAFESSAYAQGPGRCIDAERHPGRFNQAIGERRGDWVKVIRTWEDSCSGYWWFNGTTGQNNAWTWSRCIH